LKENRIPKRVLYMNLESTRPRDRWQDGLRKDGGIVGGEGWQEKVYNREEWKKFLRMARNRRILHMPVEQNRIIIKLLGHPVAQSNEVLCCKRYTP
jgi:hypothetical protein